MPLFVIPFPAFDPVLVRLGPLAVRWYALAYIVGILAGWLYARRMIRNEKYWGGPAPMTVVDFDDFVLWVTLGIILGGRIGYVLFYNFGYFAANPAEIVQLWKGGMSFHGGFLGCVLFTVLYVLIRGGALKRPGTIIGPFALGYGMIRVFCELFREPDAQLGFLWQGLTMGMLLSLPLMLAGIAFILVAQRRQPIRST